MTPEISVLQAALPLKVWLLIGLACGLILTAFVLTWLRLKREAHEAARRIARSRAVEPAPAPAPEKPTETPFTATTARKKSVFRCKAKLDDVRPLSEAQWDSEVPAQWTILRLTAKDDAAFHLGLLLPIQEPKAFSSGYLERIEGAPPEPILKGFARALGGPVPGANVQGNATGFLEFKTYVDNEKPQVIPGNLEVENSDYWILVKVFVQDTMEFYLRVNVGKGEAEIATNNPAHGEALLALLAQTLRPDLAGAG